MVGGYVAMTHPQAGFSIMVAGRVVFGLGGESMTVTQSAFVSQWFKGKELALALGFNLSTSRIGAAINGSVTPAVYKASGDNLGAPLLVGLFICIFCYFFAIAMVLLDRYAEK
jgi:MFS family permease